MKWQNKGKELDDNADLLLNNTNINKGIYVWGAGVLGKTVGKLLAQYGCLRGYIDNDSEKQNKIYCGKPVISMDEYLSLPDKGVIVLAVNNKNKEGIRLQLEKTNLIYNHDFYEYPYFVDYIFPLYSVYQFQKSFIPLAQISLTERCTLKCKKCAHACHNVTADHHDLSLDYVYYTADSFFSKVDYVQEFVLIGGEPLLYKQLAEVVNYIGEKYRNQINTFCITTNGTIRPTEEVMDICKRFNVLYRISNYSAQLPWLKEKYFKLVQLLKENEIEYKLGSPDSNWMDYGFEYVNRNASEQKLTEVFDECKTLCREIRGHKFYYCVMARSVSENLGYNLGKSDFLDFHDLQGENWKKQLLEFNMGYSEKGYLDMCNHCHGKESQNYPIPVAEQTI